jgi:hypothetical protein
MTENERSDWKMGWDKAWKLAEKHYAGAIVRWAITGAAVGGWITMLFVGH